MPRFMISVCRMTREYGAVEVEAKDAEEAEEKARERLTPKELAIGTAMPRMKVEHFEVEVAATCKPIPLDNGHVTKEAM